MKSRHTGPQLGGEEHIVTNLWTEVRHFSTVSTALGPDALIELLNVYLTAASQPILDGKGIIGQYEGDGIQAWFGAPRALPDHAAAGCRAALAIRDADMQTSALVSQQFGLQQPVVTSMGLTTGPAVVGNIGSERHMAYTVVGHDVLLARRSLALTRQLGARIVGSDAVMRAATGDFTWRALGSFRFKGLEKPFVAFELLGTSSDSGDAHERAREFERCREIFVHGDYAAAESAFRQLLDRDPHDGPARYYADQSMVRSRNPPPGDWDGIFELGS